MQKGFTHIFLILGILILAVSYWGYTKLESNKEIVSQNPFAALTPTDIPIVTGLPDKITATPIISESKTYTSEKTGVTFQYSPTYGNLELKIVENGNRIYVGSSDYLTQYIEIFETESNLSVVEDIEKRFLAGYPKDVCFINTSVPNKQDAEPANTNFEVVKIEVSHNLTLDEYTNAINLCPEYTSSRAINFFAYDTTRPDKYIYYSIGHEPPWPANSTSYEDGGDDINWMQTIEFVD